MPAGECVTVYKPKGKPHYLYDFQFQGRRHYGSTGCTTKRLAEEFERRVRHRAALPDQQRQAITVNEAAGLYQEHVERAPSWRTMRYMIAALVEGLGAGKLLSEISQRDLQVYFAKRRDGRANASVNREIENARAIWRHADDSDYDIGAMPKWGRLFLKVPRKPPRELEDTEEKKLFLALRNDVSDAVDFLLKSGWRRGEVLGLGWADVNLPRKQAITRIKGGDFVVRPLTTALVEIIARQPHSDDDEGKPFVFTYVCQKSRGNRRAGKRYPLTATALRKPFEQAKADAGVDNLRIHDLRHTRGTRIVRATGSLAAAKEALKHRRIETTLRYAHVLDDDVRNALEASESRHSPDQTKKKKRKA
ncbi:tyrosine-type recombinase/integrase [Sphingobium abikonense]|uniref:tyrosine-type recombinase/integrase n=1 Tax=Sphingobium abikonense TaxID=86193 RepID=UPI000AD64802|nr:site-specific integrase [Sphingobium abikonense]